jgi:hypothetical protein
MTRNITRGYLDDLDVARKEEAAKEEAAKPKPKQKDVTNFVKPAKKTVRKES